MRVDVRNAEGDQVTLELEPDNTVEEVIETACNHWNMRPSAYVLRKGKNILSGAKTRVDGLGLRDGDVLELIPDPTGGANLPEDLLRERLKNEFRLCQRKLKHEVLANDSEFRTFPSLITVNLNGVAGPIWRNGEVQYSYNHSFNVIINRGYPYQAPVVKWQTSIFHPNIAPPDEVGTWAGHVCTNLNKEAWTFNSKLVEFIQGIETLLITPNPKSPLPCSTCTRAAEYLNKNPLKKQITITKHKPAIVG